MATETNDLATMRERYLAVLVPAELDLKDAAAKRTVERADRAAERLMADQVMDRESKGFGSWGTVKDRNSPDLSYGGAYFGRVYGLARAYAWRHSKHYRQREVMERIVAALEFIEPFVRPGGPHPNNWWAWDIGIPMRLGDALIVLGDDLREPTRQKMTAALLDLVKARYDPAYRGGGANAIWVGMNQLRVAMITGREAYATSAARLLAQVAGTKRDLGIQRDWSYHFHGHGLNMGYGRAQLGDISQWLYLTKGTPYALPDEVCRQHEAWFVNFIVWNNYRGRVSPFTVGRSIARSGTLTSPIEVQAAAYLAVAAETDECRQAALALIRERQVAEPDGGFHTPETVALAPRYRPLLKDAPPLPTGARYYPLSDYLACRMPACADAPGRPGFYAAVRMSSTRTKAWFSIADENLKGAHSADGTLVLLSDGSEFDNGVIPTMDWSHLSGTTVSAGLALGPERAAQSQIVGGLGHRGRTGMAGMHFRLARGERQLQARKSYTVLPEGVVLLGSGIEQRVGPANGVGHPNVRVSDTIFPQTVTALHQCPLRESDRQAVVDGRPLDLADTDHRLRVERRLDIRNYAYLFPQPTEVLLRVTTTTRGYDSINRRYPSAERHTRRFYTLLVEHGTRPTDGQYAVIILPGGGEGMEPPAQVVAQTAAVHAVRAGGTTYLFGFDAWQAAGFAADRPLFVAATPETRRLILTLQDPAHRGGAVTLTVPYRVKPADGVQVEPREGASRLTCALDHGWPRELVLELQKNGV